MEIEIDLPEANYQFSRFDWSGKIVNAIYKGHSFAGAESLDRSKDLYLGRGFYNEFGIQAPLGFHEVPMGSWCHKIGVGLIKKEESAYNFLSKYDIQPLEYNLNQATDGITMACDAPLVNGYSYKLKKSIQVNDDGFMVHYLLENTGTKRIRTSEYNHNFISIEQTKINHAYQLRFSFDLDQQLFDEYVNPENKLVVDGQTIGFNEEPTREFFIANISGGRMVKAQWSLEHRTLQLGVREIADFTTNAINLWGAQHVISPELFVTIDLNPGASKRWSRKYEFYQIDKGQSQTH